MYFLCFLLYTLTFLYPKSSISSDLLLENFQIECSPSRVMVETIPADIWGNVCSYLSLVEQQRLSRSSKYFYNYHQIAWKQHLLKNLQNLHLLTEELSKKINDMNNVLLSHKYLPDLIEDLLKSQKNTKSEGIIYWELESFFTKTINHPFIGDAFLEMGCDYPGYIAKLSLEYFHKKSNLGRLSLYNLCEETLFISAKGGWEKVISTLNFTEAQTSTLIISNWVFDKCTPFKFPTKLVNLHFQNCEALNFSSLQKISTLLSRP